MKGEASDTSTEIPEEAAECFRKAGEFDMGENKDLQKKSFELTVKGFETEMMADQHHNKFLIRPKICRK